jgi:serine phosphatase RsbU (regulator of sigma subunit)
MAMHQGLESPLSVLHWNFIFPWILTNALLFSVGTYCFGQSDVSDALLGVWNTAEQTYTQRATAVDDLIWDHYMYRRPDSALIISKELLQFVAQQAKNDKALKARVSGTLGVAYWQLGRLDSAALHLQTALALDRKTGNEKAQAATLTNLGNVFADQGDYEGALIRYREAMVKQRELQDTVGVIMTLNNMGILHDQFTGKHDSAIYYYRKSLALQLSSGNTSSLSRTYNNIGIVMRYVGQRDSAMNMFMEAIKIDRLAHDMQSEAYGLNNIAYVLQDMGVYSAALDTLKKSLALRTELGDSSGVATCLNTMGRIYSKQADYQGAIDAHTRSLAIHRANGSRQNESVTLNNLGIVYRELEEYEKALEYFSTSMNIREQTGDRKGIAGSLDNQGNIYEAMGQLNRALKFYQRSYAIQNELADKRGMALSLINQASVLEKQGNRTRALNNYMKALELQTEVGDEEASVSSNLGIARILLKQNKTAEAAEVSQKAYEKAKLLGNVSKIRDCALLNAQIMEQQGNHRSALVMFKEYMLMRDSILSEENLKQALAADFKYRLEAQKAMSEERLTMQKNLSEAELNSLEWKLYAAGIGVIMLLLSGLLGMRDLQRKKRSNKLISEQKQRIEEVHNELNDSLRYAQRLQHAMLPSEASIREDFRESFVIYEPKNVVSGDFYWGKKVDDLVYFAVADCTGHGVPAAMLSVIGIDGLLHVLENNPMADPSTLLNKLNAEVSAHFSQSSMNLTDGLDIGLCRFDKTRGELCFSGANHSCWIYRGNQLIELKGDRTSIGRLVSASGFTDHKHQLHVGDMIYLFTDGVYDQFGGPNRKKLKRNQLRKMFEKMEHLPTEEQAHFFRKVWYDWKGNEEQTDDMCMIGIRWI